MKTIILNDECKKAVYRFYSDIASNPYIKMMAMMTKSLKTPVMEFYDRVLSQSAIDEETATFLLRKLYDSLIKCQAHDDKTSAAYTRISERVKKDYETVETFLKIQYNIGLSNEDKQNIKSNPMISRIVLDNN